MKNWIVGFHKTVVTPADYRDVAYYSAGYAGGCRCTEVLDDMYVRALWLDDGSEKGGVAIAVVDCVGMSNREVKDIRSLLRDFIRETGCRGVNVAFTHCHCAVDTQGLWGKLPKTGRVLHYMEILKKQIADCIRLAYAARKPGKLFWGDVKTEGLLEDTRAPMVFDDRLTRITFLPTDGSAPVAIVHFAVHPEVLGGNNPLISADFPAYMGKVLEQETGGEFVYLTGAIGGLITCPGLDDIFEKRVDNVKTCMEYGEKVASFALSIREETEIKPDLAYRNDSVTVPVSNIKFVLARKFGLITNDVIRVKNKPYRYCVPSEVGFLSLGGALHMMLIPGELYSEIAMGGYLSASRSATGREMPGDTIYGMMPEGKKLIIGLCNDEIGYIIPENDFWLHPRLPYLATGVDRFGEDHYEETNSIGLYATETILSASRKILQETGDRL